MRSKSSSRSSDPERARPEQDAFHVRQFCQRHGISTAHYYRLQKEGLGPAEMRAGGRVLISKEAAQRWRREREAETRKLEATPKRAR